jgi:hypothetical protein
LFEFFFQDLHFDLFFSITLKMAPEKRPHNESTEPSTNDQIENDQLICKFFASPTSCNRGSKCRYFHIIPTAANMNLLTKRSRTFSSSSTSVPEGPQYSPASVPAASTVPRSFQVSASISTSSPTTQQNHPVSVPATNDDHLLTSVPAAQQYLSASVPAANNRFLSTSVPEVHQQPFSPIPVVQHHLSASTSVASKRTSRKNTSKEVRARKLRAQMKKAIG